MTSRSRFPGLAALLSLAVLLLGVAPPEGLALCLGQGGHLGMELAPEDGDCPCEHESEDGDHDEDCLDLLFSAHVMAPGGDGPQNPVSAWALPSAQRAMEFAQARHSVDLPRIDATPIRPPRSLLELSAVVLRV